MYRLFAQRCTPPRTIYGVVTLVAVELSAESALVASLELLPRSAIRRINHGKIKETVRELSHTFHAVHVIGFVKL